jgi:hypothetical protein
MERSTVRVNKFGLTDPNMLDNGIMTWQMEQEFFTMLMVMFMKDNG